MNIKILIADQSKEYLDRLIDKLQEYSELDISIATSYEKLEKAMNNSKYDIILFNSDLNDSKITFNAAKLAICLYDEEQEHSGLYKELKFIRKYQRISSIYHELIDSYADEAGYTPDFSNGIGTKIVAVYSPMGGTGKTTAALVLTQQLQAAGYNSLFISLEQTDSSTIIYPHEREGITELIAAVSGSESNDTGSFEIKLRSTVKEGSGRTSYIEGFSRVIDYMDVSEDDIEKLFEKIKSVSSSDFVIVDMNSTLDKLSNKVFELADRIVIVEKDNEIFRRKFNIISSYPPIQDVWKKVVTIDNFAHGSYTDKNNVHAPNIGYISDYGTISMEDLIRETLRNGSISIDNIIG